MKEKPGSKKRKIDKPLTQNTPNTLGEQTSEFEGFCNLPDWYCTFGIEYAKVVLQNCEQPDWSIVYPTEVNAKGECGINLQTMLTSEITQATE